ncbi:VOC family protein [Runella slithyformis]|uniref:Glyoxalase/bleomycin resistance protein/dioxygenase n=1 Tax=Runella slithyformis (strain ATCC 29530 / DSM 19594 / LMG 11500 / NCIMB 11436 / LSU 4) TaxID=761193 RepID=A0A7U3ZPI9_RUNSL|nr:VOC family protein [Runella slithyformis]AEI50933.1 Glyoxalase/bleomycin resistance protein/dioxygenase [Runella slithyformis DSM 19594]
MLSIIGINHVALYVADVERSINFYKTIVGLTSLVRPAFDFPGAWFRLGTTQELHLIGIRTEVVVSGSRSNHFALEVDDLDAWEAHFKANAATYRPPKFRPDGVRQLFLQDPDGYWIEFFSVKGNQPA